MGPGRAPAGPDSPFTEWDKTFGDARLCAAIADRITFRRTLIQTGTESYRYQATQEALFPPRN
ncbi:MULTISPECIES: ATP-binding protein [unclassified Kitasatospora]|uniref:ATP-binding protein n=1 Tax=unclassified Kitasatospora TaxID=2633591 RepID=UPI0036940C79